MIPRALIWLSMCGIGITLALLLGGCATPQTLHGSGTPADAPFGYLISCTNNPDQAHCTP
jgi:hypothetical protein